MSQQPTIRKGALDYGTTANKIVVVDDQGRIPSIDSSLLTNINAGEVSGTLTNATIAGSQVQGELTTATINGSKVTGSVPLAATATQVPWSGVTSKPTTLSGYNIQVGVNPTDAVDVQTFYDYSFMNFEPKVGNSGNNTIPITVVGLTATLGPAEVFVSGIWTQLTSIQATINEPNGTNYIYVKRNDSDVRQLEAFSSTTDNPNTFSTIKVARVTTNSGTVVGVVPYAVNETTVQWDKVRNRPFSSGDIGTYIFASRNVAGDIARGTTVAGSTLVSTSGVSTDAAGAATMSTAGGLTGTWRCMGTYTYTQGSSLGATLWLRIS